MCKVTSRLMGILLQILIIILSVLNFLKKLSKCLNFAHFSQKFVPILITFSHCN